MIKNTTSQVPKAAEFSPRPTPEQGCWIKWQLDLGGIRQRMIAEEAGLASNTVSEFLSGCKNSSRIKKALCKFLGYASFAEILKAADKAKKANKRRTA